MYSSFYKRQRRFEKIQIGLYIFFILIIVAIMFVNITACFNEQTYTTTVTEKERIVQGGDSKYLIFTEDSNGTVRVFENTDIWHRGKFNSSDLYAEIKIGETYTFTTIGYRIPWMSMYENIVSIK